MLCIFVFPSQEPMLLQDIIDFKEACRLCLFFRAHVIVRLHGLVLG